MGAQAPNLRRLLCALLLLAWTPVAEAYDKTEGRAFHDAYERCEKRARLRADGARFAHAGACLGELIGQAKLQVTRAELAYRQAEWIALAGDADAARAAFLAVATAYPREALGGRARFRAALLCADRDAKTAAAELLALIQQAPDNVAAENALAHLEESMSDEARIAFYEQQLRTINKGAIITVILKHLGKAAQSSENAAARAVVVYDRLAGERGVIKRSDALYHGARARLRSGDLAGAEKALDEILRSREFTLVPARLLPGDLNSSKLDDARFLLAEIARDERGDQALARKHFEMLIEEAPLSRLLDDALLALAEMAEKSGDRKAAGRYYAELVKLRPDSRYAARARSFRD